MTDSFNARSIRMSEIDKSRCQSCCCLHVCNEKKKNGPKCGRLRFAHRCDMYSYTVDINHHIFLHKEGKNYAY